MIALLNALHRWGIRRHGAAADAIPPPPPHVPGPWHRSCQVDFERRAMHRVCVHCKPLLENR